MWSGKKGEGETAWENCNCEISSDFWSLAYFLSQIAQSVKSACVKPFQFFVLSPWTSTPEAPEDVGNETSAVAIYSLHLAIT